LEKCEENEKGTRQFGVQYLNTATPIIPLLIGDDLSAFTFTQRLYEAGIFATPVVRPAVPDGCALIRTSYMASHTDEILIMSLKCWTN
jgi:7-keto-8-aminopelargonate synthetase-like enzyme